MRLFSAEASATQERIFIMLAALNGGMHPLPLSSGRNRLSRVWRICVAEETGDSQEESFEKLYTEYGVLLRQIAIRRYRIPPDDAEELVHETFLGYLQRHTYVNDVKGYLYATVTHRCVDYWRVRQREAPLLPEHEEAADRRQEAALDTLERDLTVSAVLARLGEKCRETLRGFFFKGEEQHALADRLSTTPGYIDQLISTCRRRAVELYRSMISRGK